MDDSTFQRVQAKWFLPLYYNETLIMKQILSTKHMPKF